jgi:hypothetical protein
MTAPDEISGFVRLVPSVDLESEGEAIGALATAYINAAACGASGFQYLERTGSQRLIEVGNDVVHMFDADA